jgi:hypothetical protein
MAVTICQSMLTYAFHIAATRDARVPKRWAELATGKGPYWPIGVLPGEGREVKAALLAHLGHGRVASPEHLQRRRAFDIVQATDEVCAFFSQRAKALAVLGLAGYVRHTRPRTPRKQTAREWLATVALVGAGHPRGLGDAAAWALAEDARLNDLVRTSYGRGGGGWDLSEALGGFCAADRQLPLGFEALPTAVVRGWLVHRIRCGRTGAVFTFPVFAEWYERDRKVPPAGALRAAVPIQKPKVRLGPRPRRLFEPEAVCTEQAALPW